MRERIGLAGARAGQDQQWTRGDAFILDRRAEGGGAALLRIERVERVGLLGLHHSENYTALLYVYPDHIGLYHRRTSGSRVSGCAREEADHRASLFSDGISSPYAVRDPGSAAARTSSCRWPEPQG